MPVLEIDYKNFLRGESYGDFAPTAGFSPNSLGLNLTKDKGVLNFIETASEVAGATLTGDIIASADDHQLLSSNKYFLDDEGAFYTYSGATFTKRRTADASAGSWILGTSDIIQFKSITYATSDDRVVEIQGSDLDGSYDGGWWSGLTSGVRHPMEIVEGELFIGNSNVIEVWDGSASTTAFTLPDNRRVTSLRRHPDGRTLLAFTGVTDDFSHTKPGEGYVYYCNPAIRDWVREVRIPIQVEGTRLVGGRVYATWGKDFGFYDGEGLRVLRKLDTSTTTYSHSIANMEDILLVRDGDDILAYGDIGAGRVWWTLLDGAATINVPTYKGDNVVLYGDAAENLFEVDLDNAGANGLFRSNKIYFEKEVDIKRIDIFHDTATTYTLTVGETDLAGTTNTIEQRVYSGESVEVTRVNCNVRTDIFQLALTPGSGTIGIKLIRIHYDATE